MSFCSCCIPQQINWKGVFSDFFDFIVSVPIEHRNRIENVYRPVNAPGRNQSKFVRQVQRWHGNFTLNSAWVLALPGVILESIASFLSVRFRLRNFRNVCRTFERYHNTPLANRDSVIQLVLRRKCSPKDDPLLVLPFGTQLQYIQHVSIQYPYRDHRHLLLPLLSHTQQLVSLCLTNLCDLVSFGYPPVWEALMIQTQLQGLHLLQLECFSKTLSAKQQHEFFFNLLMFGISRLRCLSLDLRSPAYIYESPARVIQSNRGNDLLQLDLHNFAISLEQLQEICVRCARLEGLWLHSVILPETWQHNHELTSLTIATALDVDRFFQVYLPEALPNLCSLGFELCPAESWNFLFAFPRLTSFTCSTANDDERFQVRSFLSLLSSITEDNNASNNNNINHCASTYTAAEQFKTRLRGFICPDLKCDELYNALQLLPNVEWISRTPIVTDADDAQIFRVLFDECLRYPCARRGAPDQRILYDKLSNRAFLHLTSRSKKSLLDLLMNPYRTSMDLSKFRQLCRKRLANR